MPHFSVNVYITFDTHWVRSATDAARSEEWADAGGAGRERASARGQIPHRFAFGDERMRREGGRDERTGGRRCERGQRMRARAASARTTGKRATGVANTRTAGALRLARRRDGLRLARVDGCERLARGRRRRCGCAGGGHADSAPHRLARGGRMGVLGCGDMRVDPSSTRMRQRADCSRQRAAASSRTRRASAAVAANAASMAKNRGLQQIGRRLERTSLHFRRSQPRCEDAWKKSPPLRSPVDARKFPFLSQSAQICHSDDARRRWRTQTASTRATPSSARARQRTDATARARRRCGRASHGRTQRVRERGRRARATSAQATGGRNRRASAAASGHTKDGPSIQTCAPGVDPPSISTREPTLRRSDDRRRVGKIDDSARDFRFVAVPCTSTGPRTPANRRLNRRSADKEQPIRLEAPPATPHMARIRLVANCPSRVKVRQTENPVRNRKIG